MERKSVPDLSGSLASDPCERYLLPMLRCFRLALLFVVLVLISGFVLVRWQARQERAVGCDAFGYLRSAAEIRAAVQRHGLPEFSLRHPQVERLVTIAAKVETDSSRWSELVAPHAHHYDAHSRKVILQYPPGTGIVLSLFPEGSAAKRMTQCVVSILLITAAALLYRRRNAPLLRLVPLFFAAVATIVVCDSLAHYSYSVQASLVPIVFGTLLLVGAPTAVARGTWWMSASALLFSFACLVRIPNAFLFPGWAYAANARSRVRFAATYLGLTVLAVGAYQYWMTGSPWRSTYSSADNSLPTLAALVDNVAFYAFQGGAQLNWAVLGMVLVAGATRSVFPQSTRLGIKRALIVLAFPLVYFLTHRVRISYYLFPAFINALWLFAATLYYSNELPVVRAATSVKETVTSWIGTVLLIVAAVFLGSRLLNGDPRIDDRMPRMGLGPVESAILADPNAFIYADYLSGSFWYYLKRPAFKLNFAQPQLRTALVRELDANGARQYWLDDGMDLKQVGSELLPYGGSLVPVGEVFERPLYEIVFEKSS